MAKNKIDKIDPSALVYQRTKAGYTQRQFAKKINSSQTAISFFEDGRHQPSEELIEAICEVCECERIDLEYNVTKRLRRAEQVYIRRNIERIVNDDVAVEGQSLDITKADQVVKLFERYLGEGVAEEEEELTDAEENFIESTTSPSTEVPDEFKGPVVPENEVS